MNRFSLKDEYAKISCSVGYQMGGDFKRQKLTVHPELLIKGIQDALEGNDELLMNKAEMQNILVNLKKKIVATEQEEKKKAAEKNLEKGRAFLVENAKKRGVKTFESGLQYRILKKGSGTSPKPTDYCVINISLHTARIIEYRGNRNGVNYFIKLITPKTQHSIIPVVILLA